ncbi:MAG: flagellar hook-associated protein FlgL [Lachnospiraceae bacterium]|nr:flagellar hook-associated protein FlgL [Lachnospiraceae bacterium]
MRITNKIMQKNNLSNINTNKIYQDKLSNQMSTQKRVNRPSDDPVVAIRALRLRSSVTEISQYYSKNIPDAESWLSVTEDGLKNLSQIITNMITQCNKGANSYLDSSNRQIILEQLKALGDEVYTTGDADYAGRYVFTGYRTDTSLSFQAGETKKYSITEQLKNDSIDTVTNVNMGKLLELNTSNYNSGEMGSVTEQSIDSVEAYRIRLAYDKCNEDSTLKIAFHEKSTDPDTGESIYTPTTWSSDGNGDATIQVVHSYQDPYTQAATDPDAIIFVPESGEMLLGENRYNQLMTAKDDASTSADESEIQITYEKSEWDKGDLRPEHYFYCEADGITYNESYLDGERERQDIEYDVGFNQTIRINSTADECFNHGIGREVDDLVNALQEVQDIETVKVTIESAMETASEEDRAILQTRLDAAEKALTLANDKCQKLFESGITTFQKHLDDANLCITNCGTRSSKLELIKTRMQNQKTTFETLKSENEDIDITEVAIQLSSAELTYEAALMATGKVMQTTLLNYI